MTLEIKIKRSDLGFERWESSLLMKKLLEYESLNKVLDKYEEKQKFYEVLRSNIDPDRLDSRNLEISIKKTLGHFLADKSDSLVTEEVELVGKEFFGDESYAKRFIMPEK